MTTIKSILRITYAPMFFVSFIGLALYSVQMGLPKWTLSFLLIAAILISFLAERILPYEREWNSDQKDSATNIFHALVNESSIFILVMALPLVSALIPNLGLWPNSWPMWLQLALAIIIADFGISLTHFASHRYSWLWRFHEVHHAAPRLYGFNGLMKHPIHQTIELTAATTPLLIMGIGSDVAWLLSFSVGIQLLLQHSNVDMKIGVLSYIWAVAPAHRHHHLASAKDGNVNFSLFTSLWDFMLGTFVINRPSPRAGEIGIDGDKDYPRDYISHLKAPFVRDAAPLAKDT